MASIPGVLVVDPDPEARFQVGRLVRQAEFDVSAEAGLGTEAVAQALETLPDVIMCALDEPIVRALQTIEGIVRSAPHTPVIAYAEGNDIRLIRRAMLAGARDFLQAPFKADELARSLASALESEERRRMGDASGAAVGPTGTVLTVCGSKGGVGKTTIATNLAVALTRVGDHRVVLVDADDTFGDAGDSLALRAERSVTDALRDIHREGDVLRPYLTYHSSGLALLCGPPNPLEWRGIENERLLQLLGGLARRFDVVIIDTGYVLAEASLSALAVSSAALWITTPDYASVHDSLQAFRVLHELGRFDDRIRVVLNLASADVEVRRESIEEALSCPVFWTVPFDRDLRRTAQVGNALVESNPRNPAAANLMELAAVVGGTPPEPSREGLFGRLFASRQSNAIRWREART